MASHPPQVLTKFLLMSVLSYVIVVSERCKNPPPGIRRMIRGVDVTQLDLLPLETLGSNGFKNPVISFTCNQDQTWTSPRGGDYQLPDQLWHLNSLPGGWLYAETKIYKTYQDVKRTMTRNVGGEFSITNFGFSASHSYKDMQNTIVNTSHYIADVGAFDSATQANFVPSWRLKLDMFAQEYVDQMLPVSFESNPAAYNRFIQEFGTHYFASANFGGFIRVVHKIKSNFFSSTNEENVETQAKASFFGILKAHGGQVSSSTQVNEQFRQATTVSTRYYGGHTNLLEDNGIQQWQPTVYNDPWLFSGTLKPISDLIRDESKKTSMVKAVTTYILKIYLDELERLLATVKCGSKLADANSLKSRVSDKKSNTVLTEDEVTALGLEVDGLTKLDPPRPSTAGRRTSSSTIPRSSSRRTSGRISSRTAGPRGYVRGANIWRYRSTSGSRGTSSSRGIYRSRTSATNDGCSS